MSRHSPARRPTDAGSDPGGTGGTSGTSGTGATGLRGAVSRRKIFTSAVGAAAAGTAAGTVLTGASPALAAGGTALARRARGALALQATTVEQAAVAPAVVGLTDAPTIAMDASLGNDFRVAIAGNRTIANPSNPTDGQKVVLHVTQAAAGSFTVTWGSAFQFSDGLPKPVLSNQAGKTDLFGFIYNAAKEKWLLVAYVRGFSSTAVVQPNGTYRLFPATNGPASPVSYSGPFMAGVLFRVTSGGTWFDGYWWWVCPSGQSTAPQKFALWAVYNTGVGALVPGATVTSGPLTAGQWNYVPLNQPVPLSIGACYNACTGFPGSFPDTTGQYSGAGPYSAGIAHGPLSAFSDQSGSQPAPFAMSQGVFSVAGSDPTAIMPSNGNQSDNLWMDLQVDTNPPARASYRLWPSYPRLPGSAWAGPVGYTLGTEIQLSQSCALNNIWFYSPHDAEAVPTRCAIWDASTQTVVSGTDNGSPSWSGTAGSGWITCPYSGVTLPAGDYKVAVFYGGLEKWFQFALGYWGSGPGAGGISSGPLTAPGLSDATSPGQATYNEVSWAYPSTYGSVGDGENYWVDVEVTPT
jgi:hypothetical protein